MCDYIVNLHRRSASSGPHTPEELSPSLRDDGNIVYGQKASYVEDTNPPITYFCEVSAHPPALPPPETPTSLADMSLNNFSNMFPPEPANQASVPRLAPSPMQAQQANGNGAGMNGMNVGMPMSAGQQMDVNLLYQKVVELSEVLKENREKTAGIVAGAEELAVCAICLRQV